MPTLVRWFVKSSLVWFIVALLMGVASLLDRFLPLWVFLAMAAGVARYSFLWKATWENSSRMVRWNRSQMPLVCGERAFVRVWSAAYRAGKEGVPRAGAQISSAAVVYRKKGFTVSLERDETTRRLAELLPTSVVGVEVKEWRAARRRGFSACNS